MKNFQKLIVLSSIFVFTILTFDVYAQYIRKESFSTEKQRRLKYDLDDWVSYMKSRKISSMTVGTDYIYFGTLDGGILRFDYFANKWDYPFTTSNGLPANKILNVVYDKSNSFLWAVTENDVAIFKPSEQEWLRKSDADFWPYTFPEVPKLGEVNQIQQNIFYPREYLDQLPTFFANGDYTIIDDWVLMDRNFRDFPITGFFKDYKERIWFMVDGFGVGMGDLFIQRADFYEFGLPDINPIDIEFYNDDLWIGGLNREGGRAGIALWQPDKISWQYFEARWISHLPDDNVNDILVDEDYSWFATEYGVSLYDAGKDKWKNFSLKENLISNTVLDVERLGNYVYAATDQGLSRINRLTGNVKSINNKQFLNLRINQLTSQRDTLWAATEIGIYRFISKLNIWQFVSSKAAIQDFRMTAVFNYKNEMWFASENGIMWLNLKTEKWESYPQIAMEIYPPFRDIQVNAKSVWVATSSGLLKFDKINKFWKLFTVDDGLLDNNCHRILLDGDHLWVTTDSGITRFYWDNPQRID
jgi:ligand-binding sensor domain-containing protein